MSIVVDWTIGVAEVDAVVAVISMLLLEAFDGVAVDVEED